MDEQPRCSAPGPDLPRPDSHGRGGSTALVHHAVAIECDVPSHRTEPVPPEYPLAPAPGHAPVRCCPAPADVLRREHPGVEPAVTGPLRNGRGVDERGAASTSSIRRANEIPGPPAGRPGVAATALERRGADAPGPAGPVPEVAGRARAQVARAISGHEAPVPRCLASGQETFHVEHSPAMASQTRTANPSTTGRRGTPGRQGLADD